MSAEERGMHRDSKGKSGEQERRTRATKRVKIKHDEGEYQR